MAYCGNCGKEVPDGTKFCPNCGAQIGPVEAPKQEVTTPINAKHGTALASMIIGIVGVASLFFIVSIGILPLILGIIGLVLAGNAKKAGNSEGIRTAGFVLSLIALIIGAIEFVVLLIAIIFTGAAVIGAAGGWLNYLNS